MTKILDRINPPADPATSRRSATTPPTSPDLLGALVNPATRSTTTTKPGASPGSPEQDPGPDHLLFYAAAFVDDVEDLRITTENRLRAMDSGFYHGDANNPPLQSLAGSLNYAWYNRQVAQLEFIKQIEHQAILDLQRMMRKHPLGPWVKRTVGVGEKQGARLIASIGDPLEYVSSETGEVVQRNVAKLWAYCGFHVIDGKRPRRVKGVQSNWNPEAKMRARLIAESCIKHSHSPYRAVYDRERARWADRDTSDLHKHNHALAVVAKEVLKDIWREARDLRDRAPGDTQTAFVA